MAEKTEPKRARTVKQDENQEDLYTKYTWQQIVLQCGDAQKAKQAFDKGWVRPTRWVPGVGVHYHWAGYHLEYYHCAMRGCKGCKEHLELMMQCNESRIEFLEEQIKQMEEEKLEIDKKLEIDTVAEFTSDEKA